MTDIVVEAKFTGDSTDLLKAMQQGTKAGDDFEKGMKSAGDNASSGFSRAGQGIMSVLKKIGGAIALYFGARQIVSWAKDSIAALANWQAIQAQTNAVIASTGNAAGVTSDAIHDLAQSLEGATATSAEAIQQNANLLLTFKNVKNAAGEGNDIFDQSVRIFTDMQRAVPSANMMQFGRALNDPIKGVSALTRVGVQFTDQQKAQIQALQESGDMMGAQRILLEELNSQFGGSGAAYRETFGGQMYAFKDAVGDLGEALFSGLMPALGKMADIGTTAFSWLAQQPAVTGFGGKVVEVFSSLWTAVQPVAQMFANTLGPVLQTLGPQLLALWTAVSPLGVVFTALQPSLGIVADLLRTVGEALSGALAGVLPVITDLMSQLAGILSGVLAAVLPIIARLISMAAENFASFLPVIIQVADVVGQVLMAALEALMPVLPPLLDVFLQLFSALSPLIPPILGIVMAFMPLIQILGELVAAVLPIAIELFTAILGPILQLITPLVGLLAPALQFVADGLSLVIGWIADGIDWFMQMNAQAESTGGGVSGAFSAMFDIVKAIFDGLVAAVTFVVDTTKSNFDRIVSTVQFVGSVFKSVFSAIGGFISGAFSNATSVVKGAINAIIGMVNGAIAGLNSLKVSVPDWVPLIGGQTWGVSLPKIPMLAEGGTITAPGLTWVGERGPELINLPRGASVVPLDYRFTLDDLAGGGGFGSGGGPTTVTYDIDVHVDRDNLDDEELGSEIGSAVKFAVGG